MRSLISCPLPHKKIECNDISFILRYVGVCILFFICTVLNTSCDQAPEGLTFRLSNFHINLDPSTLADVESRKIATLIHSGLVAVDLEGRVYPRLAESWSKDDSNTWTFKLKKDVQFADGHPVNAKAVAKSLCWSMQKSHLYSWALTSVDHNVNADGSIECTGITAVDEYTVAVRETEPVPWFLESLDGPAGWIVGNPGEKPEAWGVRSGVGPYKIAQVKSDSEIVLTSFENGVVKPEMKRITFRLVTDPSVAARMFKDGDLDMLQVENPNVLTYLNREKSNLVKFESQRFRVVIINRAALEKKGWTEQQIQSFINKYADQVDRRRISDLSEGLAGPMMTAFPPAIRIESYAPNFAAGSSIDLPEDTLYLITANDAYSDLIASALPTQIGPVKIDYRAVESSLLISALFTGEAELASIGVEATSSSPFFWGAFWTFGSPFSTFGTPLPVFSELKFIDHSDVLTAAETVDSSGNWVGLLHENGLIAVSPKFKGLRLTPSGQVSLEESSIAPH